MNNNWRNESASRGHGDLFFPPSSEDPARKILREEMAVKICGECSVMDECTLTNLYEASSKNNYYGQVFGGLSSAEIRKIVRAPALRLHMISELEIKLGLKNEAD